MQTCLECLPCIVKQSLAGVTRVIPDRRRQEAVLREVFESLTINHWHLSPPYLMQKIHRIIREWSGERDPYREAKQAFNQIAPDRLPGLEQTVRNAEDPFELAARIAIAGNIIDLGIVPDLDEERLGDTIEQALHEPLAVNDLGALREAMSEAERILYLGDNAGEIVLDRLLLSQLPLDKVTFVVRGEPILNDATLEEAEAAGLTGLVRVIDNGSDAPGTILGMCSEEFRGAFARADLVIAKGQGNYESLSDQPHPNLFFLFKIKCPVVAEALGAPLGGLVVKRSSVSCDAHENASARTPEMRQPV